MPSATRGLTSSASTIAPSSTETTGSRYPTTAAFVAPSSAMTR